MKILHPILNSFCHLCKICDVYIHKYVLLYANMQKLLTRHMRAGTTQGRRNGFEHGGDGEPSVTFEPFMVQISNLQI